MLFPEFWLKQRSNKFFLKYLLLPATLIWRLLLKLERSFVVPRQSPIPIICVGNITIGGNGKTPTSMKIRSLLKKSGFQPHILSKGYKSKFKGPHLVDPIMDSFLDVGDEPLMMALYGPTWIARDRYSGIKAAMLSGADIIILDDGFQNHSIVKDFSILVIETSIAFGNGYLIPAGPLREPIAEAFKRADLLLTIGEKHDCMSFKKEFSHFKLPTLIDGKFMPKKSNPKLKNKRVLAFSGIGHPNKFRITLERLGAIIFRFETFKNHQPFKLKVLDRLIYEAKKNEAMLITTEKDFVKIPEHLRNNFYTLTVDLNISNQEFVLKKIQSIIQEKN